MSDQNRDQQFMDVVAERDRLRGELEAERERLDYPHEEIEDLRQQLAADRAGVSDLESLVWDVWINEMRRSEIDKSIERIKQAAETQEGGR